MNKNLAIKQKSNNNNFLRRQRFRSKTLTEDTLTPISSSTLDTNYDKYDYFSSNETSKNLGDLDVQNFNVTNSFTSLKALRSKVAFFIKLGYFDDDNQL